MAATVTKEKSIEDIVKGALRLEQIKKQDGEIQPCPTFVLPEFQRDYQWTHELTLDLFDSIFRDVYIGSIVMGKPSFDISVRPIDLRKRSRGLKGKKPKPFELMVEDLDNHDETIFMILDGQQRVTSLVRALTASDTNDHTYFVAKKTSDRPPLEHEIEDFSKYLHEFSSDESEDMMSIELSHVWDAMRGDIDLTEKEELCKPLFESEYYNSLTDTEKENETKYFKKLLLAIKKKLESSKIVQISQMNTSLENFTLFFERSNSKAVRLSFIDILTAKVFSKCNLRKKWDELESEMKSRGMNFDIEKAKEPIIRLINYFYKIDDVVNGKIDKNDILKNLSGDHINDLFDNVSNAWLDVISWLIATKVIPGQGRLPYDKMVMPVMAYKLEKKTEFNLCPPDQTDDIVKWIFTCAICERYSMKTNERYKTDIEAMINLANGTLMSSDKDYLDKIKHKIRTNDDLISVTASTGALPTGLQNMIHYENQGSKSWMNGKNQVWTSKSKFESHHIFPKDFLGDEMENRESTVNRVYIPKLLNIKISNKSPNKYFSEIEKINANLGSQILDELIPNWIFNESTSDRYQEFLRERATKLMKLVDKYTF